METLIQSIAFYGFSLLASVGLVVILAPKVNMDNAPLGADRDGR